VVGGLVKRRQRAESAASAPARVAARDRQHLVAVSRPLAEARGAPVDVLDPDCFGLERARVEPLAVADGVHDLVQQRGGRIAEDGPSRIAVAALLELGAELGVPHDPTRLIDTIGVLEHVPRGLRVRADLVAGAGTASEPVEQRDDLRRLAARVDAPSNALERRGDADRIGGTATRDELGTAGERSEEHHDRHGGETAHERGAVLSRRSSAGKRKSGTRLSGIDSHGGNPHQ
jgi:hypothetical protein